MTEASTRETMPKAKRKSSIKVMIDDPGTELQNASDEDRVKDFRNQFILGDSLEVMRKIPSESIDLVVTSPPYN